MEAKLSFSITQLLRLEPAHVVPLLGMLGAPWLALPAQVTKNTHLAWLPVFFVVPTEGFHYPISFQPVLLVQPLPSACILN